VGDADRAFDLRINPSAREDITDLHRCEPYVYTQMIAGKDASTHGEAKNSWLTGSAAWNLVAVTQWILGPFRGATYRITVRKPAGTKGRVSSLVVDGRRIEGTMVPPAPEVGHRYRRGRDRRTVVGSALDPGSQGQALPESIEGRRRRSASLPDQVGPQAGSGIGAPVLGEPPDDVSGCFREDVVARGRLSALARRRPAIPDLDPQSAP
jgi:hypothetical protein